MEYPIRLTAQLRSHLRALRKQRGMTQAQLGQKLGIGQVRVAEIEAKPGLVSVEQLVKLISALGATLVLRDPMESGVEPPVQAKLAASRSQVRKRPTKPSSKPVEARGGKRTTDSSPVASVKNELRVRIPVKKGSW